jgi:hypothetical protein
MKTKSKNIKATQEQYYTEFFQKVNSVFLASKQCIFVEFFLLCVIIDLFFIIFGIFLINTGTSFYYDKRSELNEFYTMRNLTSRKHGQ